MPDLGSRVPALPGAEILAYLRGRQDAMVDLLCCLAELESPSAVPEAQRPVLELLAQRFQAIGYRARLLAGGSSGGHLLARPAAGHGQAPRQLLLGHCDTVWPLGTLAEMPVKVENSIVRGPGVFDMKGGLVQMLFALAALDGLGLQPPAMPVAFVNSDEETGSTDSKRWIVRLAGLSCRAFVLEPALGRSGRLKTARKGVGGFTIRVRPIDRGWPGSTVLELSHVIQKLFALNDPGRGITVNVGLIDGGHGSTALESRAEVDVRVPDAGAAAEVLDGILSMQPVVPGVELAISGGLRRPAMEPTPRNRALWRQARALGREIGLDLEEGMAGGGSDGNFASQHTATLDGLGAVGNGAHARHEFVFADRLPERAALLALLLMAPI